MVSPFYTSTDAADYVGTSPRLLRRFIRQNDSWKNATQAGRYMFSESEVKSLKIQFEAWQRTRSSRATQPQTKTTELDYLDEDKGISPYELDRIKRDPRFRKQVLERRALRMRKLDQRIVETGIRKAVDA